MDLTALNNAVLSTWGEKLQVTIGNITHDITGIYIDAYAQAPVGNTEVERPDPSFSFRTTEYNQLSASVDDQITHDGITYSIISAPTYENGNWCNVAVSEYS